MRSLQDIWTFQCASWHCFPVFVSVGPGAGDPVAGRDGAIYADRKKLIVKLDPDYLILISPLV